MGTRTDDSVDWVVRTNFLADVLQKTNRNWTTVLSDIGVDTIVFHRDWFPSNDLSHIDFVLEQWFGEPTTESKSGHIQIWSLPGPIATRSDAKESLKAYFPELQ